MPKRQSKRKNPDTQIQPKGTVHSGENRRGNNLTLSNGGKFASTIITLKESLKIVEKFFNGCSNTCMSVNKIAKSKFNVV